MFNTIFLIIKKMCWSLNASFVFSSLGIMYSYYVFKNDKKYNVVDKMTILFYTIMELTQFIQYYYIEQCTPMNYYLTIFAHILIWVQPFLSNYYGYCETKKNEQVFIFAMIMSFIIFIVSCIQLYVGEYCESCGKINNMLNAGNNTCTSMGTIHLQWQFKYASLRGFNANWLIYVLLVFLPNIFHSESVIGRPLNWLYPLLFAIIAVGEINNEIISLWCAYTIPYGIFLVMNLIIKESVTIDII